MKKPRSALALVIVLSLAPACSAPPAPPPSAPPPIPAASPAAPASSPAAPAPTPTKRTVRVGVAQESPPELRNRSIATVDELPPPADGQFHSTIVPAPAEVLARSTWTKACPVPATDLRYVTVGFRGFDGRAHT